MLAIIILSCVSYRASYVEINGTHYARGNIVLCTFDEDIPVFGKIIDIVAPAVGESLFILIPYFGYAFNRHYNCFEVHTGTNYYYSQNELADYHTLSLNKSFDHSLAHNTLVCVTFLINHDNTSLSTRVH